MKHPASTLALLVLVVSTTVALAHESGVVDQVIPGSAAAAAGVQPGDRITRLDGLPLRTRDDLQKIVASHRPGDTVPLVVERDGETLTLQLTFGARPDGGASIGVAVGLEAAAGARDAGAGTAGCLAWIAQTYKIESALESLQLDVREDWATVRRCVERDTARMSAENAVRYCDNVFKVHCSANDLLAQIGEAWIDRCAASLDATLGLNPARTKGWRTCAAPKLFDAYVRSGQLASPDDCRTTFLEVCGTGLDHLAESGELSAERRAFIDCCSADVLDPAACSMIGEGSARGPCHDHPVCINQDTTEWVHCSAVQ